MTIDEAILKYKEITNTDAICPAHCNISCDKCEQESKQLTEWLEELSKRRVEELFRKENEKAIRDKAIDDFVNRMLEEGIISLVQYVKIKEIAEQLKENNVDSN